MISQHSDFVKSSCAKIFFINLLTFVFFYGIIYVHAQILCAVFLCVPHFLLYFNRSSLLRQ